MEVTLEVDATGRKKGARLHPAHPAIPEQLPAKVKVGGKSGFARIAALKLETDALQISPSSPLVSTALQENAWVCGQNSNGQLGLGNDNQNVAQPQPLRSLRWKALSLGDNHAAGVGDGGEVYTWGLNDKGQLGAQGGPVAGRWDVPRRMELLYGWDVRAIACGAEHTVAITPHDVITWGSNEAGQCGHGEKSETDWVKPRSLKVLHGQLVTQVVCGRFHTMCVTATSVVYAWGRNSNGQLGLGDAQDRRSPAIVEALWALPVLQLAAGDAHSAALTSNGFLFTWGGNERGQLGLPAAAQVAQQHAASRTASERRRSVRRVNQRFLQALAEMGIPQEQAELALTQTGNVGVEVATEWLFSLPADVLETHLSGRDSDTPSGSLDVAPGDGEDGAVARMLAPRRVPLQGVRSVACGWTHTVAVTDEEVYSWGDNASGQLGLRSFRSASQPAEVSDLSCAGVCSVACGQSHTLFVCRDGRVFGCGDLGAGALAELDDPDPEASLREEEWWRTALAADSGESGEDNEAAAGALHANPYAALRNAPSSGRVTPEGGFGAPSPGKTPAPARYVSAPTLLRLKFLHGKRGANAPVVTQAAAARGTSAFLARAADELPEPPPIRLWERLQGAVATARAAPASELEGHVHTIASAVERVFASAAAISAAFGVVDGVGLEVGLLDSVQRAVLELEPSPAAQPGEPQPERDELHRSMRRALDLLMYDLEKNVQLLGTPERAQVVLAAMLSPLLGDTRCASALIPRACNVVLAAPASCRHLLVKWWAECPADLLEGRVVRPLQRYLTDELYATKKLTVSVMNVIKVLAVVEEGNQLGRKMPPEAFYNELISEKLDVLDHYVAWRQTHDMPQHNTNTDGPFSFCSFPFLLNPRAKSKLLHTEARSQMDQAVAIARAEQPASAGAAVEEAVATVKPRTAAPSGSSSSAAPVAATGVRAATPPPGDQPRLPRPRRDRHSASSTTSPGGGLRWLFHSPGGRHTEQPPASPATDDERRAAASTSPGGPLWKQGSLGLPAPQDSGFPATHPDMCILRVRRGHLVEDALAEVARQRPRDLFKPLRVHFIGEDGIDAGGVKKEFFQLLLADMLCPDYGMLQFLPECRTYWFNPTTLEPDEDFLLLGLVVGLAVYNGVLLDLPLPLALYRKVLGQEVQLRDLEEMQPTLGRSLRQLLQHEGPGSVEDVFCQTFSVEVPAPGELRSVALKPGGQEIAVTEDTRREFVDLYVDWWLNTSVHSQFEAFAKGLLTLCGGPALQLFSATELERLVCGSPCLDFDALVRSARYEGGYHADHRVVQWLWQVVAELATEEQKLFLKFFTGSDRAPIGGLANLRCIIQRDGADSNKLPTSHTCFNTLLLPSYRSKDKLADRLKLAILNAEGFGLE